MYETPKPDRTEAKMDARIRGWRTALQGLAATVLVALAVATRDVVTPGEAVDWAVYGVATGTAALTAVAAWVMRRFGK